MRATLKQLAERTGLSISTVSRVVTGKGYVSGESRKMVEEAVKAGLCAPGTPSGFPEGP